MMNSVEIKNAIRDNATEMLLTAFPTALARNGKDYTFIVPVDIEGTTYYCQMGLTSVQFADTKARPAFDPDNDATPAREAYENMKAEREANKKAAEEAKAQKRKAKAEERIDF